MQNQRCKTISAARGATVTARGDGAARLLTGLPLLMALALVLALLLGAAHGAEPDGAAAPTPASPPTAAAPATGDSAPVVTPVADPAAPAKPPAATLDGRIQDIKTEAIELNRDLMVLEEELLFPANTQVAVFVSLDVGKLFGLDSVQVKLDDKEVANYLYTPAEVESLHRGGVQRLYLGNLRSGPHELVAYFVGKGPHDRDYRRGTTVKFEKGTDPKYIELQIKDATGKLQPEFSVKVWQ